MLSWMQTTTRLQPLRAAALVAAAMLLAMTLAAATAGGASSSCMGTCPALRCVAGSNAACPIDSSEVASPARVSTDQLGRVSPGAIACVSAPAGWRTLDLPPPVR
jgi:hypothetical protein